MSKRAGVSIGIMDPAYFVGRKEVLRWLNDLLKTDFKKIEETANGAAACQVLDVMFKGTVPMKKVNWGARSDYEFVKNYKVLQSVFNKHKIEKHVDVEKLIRGKYQDNLEWMQWLKSFYESNMGDDEAAAYNAESRRSRSKGAPKAVKRTSSPAKAKKPVARTTKSRRPPAATAGPEKENRKKSSAGPQVKKLTAEVAELKLLVEGLEKERDFYFNKLRDVELLLQNEKLSDAKDEGSLSAQDISKQVLAVLYATDDDDAGATAADASKEKTVAANEEEMLF